MARIVLAEGLSYTRGIPMRGNIVGLLAAALMAVCGVASANIIYNVDISGGGETVTGTITTDGASGLLTAADFVSWSLAVTGSVTFNDSGPPFAAFCDVSGCGVSAGVGALTYVGGVGLQSLFLEAPSSPVPVSISFRDEEVVLTNSIDEGATIPEGTSYLVGTGGRGSVPEPPTAILLAIGLVGLGSVYMRARGRQRAAV
jgi:hypothetical protein